MTDYKNVAIGIAGHAKSGKTSLATALHARTKFPAASFGRYVTALAETRRLPMNTADERRATLMALGEILVRDHLHEFCDGVLQQVLWRPGEGIVIEGIRHASVIHELRRILSPMSIHVVLVDVPTSVREQRLSNDGLTGLLTRQAMDAHSTEREVSKEVALLADQIVDGTLSPDSLAEAVLRELQMGG